MRRALDLARRGQGLVEPNPMVGCVVIQDGVELSHGWHERFGGPHAEVHALSSLPEDTVRECDVFVTLEPCAHHGKTPPCLDLLIKRKPRRVVVAMLDPFPQVAGRGVSGLRRAGIHVDVGILEREARLLNAPYIKRCIQGYPWIIAKWAMTLDGAIATHQGDSKWITGEAARNRAHELRARVDVVLVGSETVLRDDPLLTARLPANEEFKRIAKRTVLDRRLRIPLDSRLVRTAGDQPLCIVTTRPSVDAAPQKVQQLLDAGTELVVLPDREHAPPLDWLMRHWYQAGATNVLVEGGGVLLGAFFDEGRVDQVECFIAPRILGSSAAKRPIEGKTRAWIAKTQTLQPMTVDRIGEDIHIWGLVRPSNLSTPSVDERTGDSTA